MTSGAGSLVGSASHVRRREQNGRDENRVGGQ